jgi:hypothetical protein
VFQRGRFQGRTHITVKTIKATRWASVSEIEAAWQAWPKNVSDDVHIRSIMAETGLSRNAAFECLMICTGRSEGDCIEVAD